MSAPGTTKAGVSAPALGLSRIVAMKSFAQDKHGESCVKNLAENFSDHSRASRQWFAALLWRAFPAASENELIHRAAPVLDVSPRQVKNWLRCENDASLRYVTAVMLIAGGEALFRMVERAA